MLHASGTCCTGHGDHAITMQPIQPQLKQPGCLGALDCTHRAWTGQPHTSVRPGGIPPPKNPLANVAQQEVPYPQGRWLGV